MADTDKAQIAALGRARLGTMYDYHRMWKAQRAAQGLPYDDATWEAWLVERLRTGDAEIERLRKENEQYVIWSHEHSAWWRRPAQDIAGMCVMPASIAAKKP